MCTLKDWERLTLSQEIPIIAIIGISLFLGWEVIHFEFLPLIESISIRLNLPTVCFSLLVVSSITTNQSCLVESYIPLPLFH